MSESIAFLDTSLSIRNSRISVDLYRKPSDRCAYLLPSSCHPPHTTKNIPFSLALRIVRICTDTDSRDLRLRELKEMLRSRDYGRGLIDAAILRASAIPRSEALKRVVREKGDIRPVFAVTYDPRLPSITHLIRKHYRVMVANDPRLAEVFPHCPLVAYKRPPNLKELLIRAKLPPIARSLRPTRIVKGCKPCNKPCSACPYITHTKTIKSSVTGAIVYIIAPVDCSTTWVIYVVTCLKRGCKMQYVGKTEREFRTRVKEHVRYIENGNVSQATGHHFCQSNHNITDFSIAILEKVNTSDTLYIEEREREWIRKFNCKYRGINRSY